MNVPNLYSSFGFHYTRYLENGQKITLYLNTKTLIDAYLAKKNRAI